MTINWPYLVAALVLLLPPLPFSDELRRTLGSVRRAQFATVAGAIKVWQNWADLVRAALGVYLLTQWAIVTSDTDPGSSELKATAIKAALLFAVLLVQTIRLLRNLEILAPVFFLCGITLILGGYLQGGFAVVVGWMFAIGGKNLSYQLPAMMVALGAAGYVLGFGVLLIFDCALIVVPFALATVLRKRLVFVSAPKATLSA